MLKDLSTWQQGLWNAARGRSNARGHAGFNNNKQGCGRDNSRGRNNGGNSDNHPKCQLCYKQGHAVKDCWYRYISMINCLCRMNVFAGTAASYGVDTN